MIHGVKISITEWALPIKFQGPMVCRVAKDAGLDGVELVLGDAQEGFPLANEYAIARYQEARADTGVAFNGLAINMTDFFPMTAPRRNPERQFVDRTLRLGVDCAARLAIPLVQIPSFNASDIATEDDLENTVECLQSLCDYAVDKGVVVSTENSLDAATQLREIEMVNRPNFKVYFDTQNYFLQKGFDQPSLIPPIIDHIVETHVKDGIGDISNRLLGEGENRVYDSLAVFFAHGYSGWLVLENYYGKKPLCEMDGGFMAALKKDVAILAGWLKQLKA